MLYQRNSPRIAKFYLNLNTDKQGISIAFIIPRVDKTYEALFKENEIKKYLAIIQVTTMITTMSIIVIATALQ
jgi:hypothetical protein